MCRDHDALLKGAEMSPDSAHSSSDLTKGHMCLPAGKLGSQDVSPEGALSALLLEARSGGKALLLLSVTSMLLMPEPVLAANPAVRLPFELETEPTLAPESAVEPDPPCCCGDSITTTLPLPLPEWLPSATLLLLKLCACGTGLVAKVDSCVAMLPML